jgi:hypothetical protein
VTVRYSGGYAQYAAAAIALEITTTPAGQRPRRIIASRNALGKTRTSERPRQQRTRQFSSCGDWFRAPLLAAMTWYSLRDRL